MIRFWCWRCRLEPGRIVGMAQVDLSRRWAVQCHGQVYHVAIDAYTLLAKPVVWVEVAEEWSGQCDSEGCYYREP